MIVKELIEVLKTMPQDAVVIREGDDYPYLEMEIGSVYIRGDKVELSI